MTSAPTVVIGSAGRRLYLIDWFREALAALVPGGQVVVTENDPTSSSATYGDIARTMPRYTDPEYAPALLELVDEFAPRIFLSVNDYELMHLHVHTDLAGRLHERGVLVPGVSAAWQLLCADKLLMARALAEEGIRTPVTVTGGDVDGIAGLGSAASEVVVKHRLGSGSSGLAVVPIAQASAAVADAVRTAPSQGGGLPGVDDVVVQPRLAGIEHGVDVVADLRRPGILRGVLARRKLRMRSGETDKAVTVDPAPFRDAAERLARASGLTGLVDVDMFLEDDGSVSVIDVNPRFGGGYPFVHLAGADVPRSYVAQAFDLVEDPAWLECTHGTVGAKYESVRVTGRVTS
ncbi:ATP-grasp domain-containing protein [Brachybacterium phenoliresistens]|uniref:ATP-grasp domain-containing protein n=1 Tax=Brachybacterium phenoliresistens TaxID=396014 RepID=UPI0031DB63D6